MSSASGGTEIVYVWQHSMLIIKFVEHCIIAMVPLTTGIGGQSHCKKKKKIFNHVI